MKTSLCCRSEYVHHMDKCYEIQVISDKKQQLTVFRSGQGESYPPCGELEEVQNRDLRYPRRDVECRLERRFFLNNIVIHLEYIGILIS